MRPSGHFVVADVAPLWIENILWLIVLPGKEWFGAGASVLTDNISFPSDTRNDALPQTIFIRRTDDPVICPQLTIPKIYNFFFRYLEK